MNSATLQYWKNKSLKKATMILMPDIQYMILDIIFTHCFLEVTNKSPQILKRNGVHSREWQLHSLNYYLIIKGSGNYFMIHPPSPKRLQCKPCILNVETNTNPNTNWHILTDRIMFVKTRLIHDISGLNPWSLNFSCQVTAWLSWPMKLTAGFEFNWLVR